MKFLEYLKEADGKELYTIINTHTGDVPKENNEPFTTWAVSPAKAKEQILFRMRRTPDKYVWKVLNNRGEYEAITWDNYKQMTRREENQYTPPKKPTPQQPQQLSLFDDPNITTPY